LNSNKWTPDGLLGLGFPIVSVFDEPSVFENIITQGQATDAVFVLKLDRDQGKLTFGGPDPKAFHRTPIFTPVTQDGFWQIKFSSFKVGDEVLAGPTQALVDSVRLESMWLFCILTKSK
jgi:Eukaryotic aspartyl protease